MVYMKWGVVESNPESGSAAILTAVPCMENPGAVRQALEPGLRGGSAPSQLSLASLVTKVPATFFGTRANGERASLNDGDLPMGMGVVPHALLTAWYSGPLGVAWSQSGSGYRLRNVTASARVEPHFVLRPAGPDRVP